MARRNYLSRATSTATTPQSEPIPGSAQVANSAGGYSFALDKWKRLDRFLILGSEGGTYYISERNLVKQSTAAIEECMIEDPQRLIARIVEISEAGRAPNNDPALFALARIISCGVAAVRKLAGLALPKVARTGTHLFHFAEFAGRKDGNKRTFRGWGPVLRRAVGDWYNARDARSLSYQLVKYQSRDGWSHRDLLRLAHPKPIDETHQLAMGWAVDKVSVASEGEIISTPLEMIYAAERAKTADEKETIKLIRDHNLPRECVMTEHLKSTAVWDALLPKMPLAAMIRNLGNMTMNGLIAPNSAATAIVIAALSNRAALKKARIHPLTVFMADATYRQGRGTKGSNVWTPVAAIRDQLEEVFYTTFDLVEPTNKRWFLGLDVSGSMGSPMGRYPITCREASALMAMVTMRTEKIHFVGGFTSGNTSRTFSYGGTNPFMPLDISARMKMETVRDKISNLDFGNTDCALPMRYAMKEKIPADVFVIYTDSETWAGDIHPIQALNSYRQAMGIPAKLVVVGMVSNGFSIADPNDAGMLDVVGFDTSVPSVLSDFVTDGRTQESRGADMELSND